MLSTYMLEVSNHLVVHLQPWIKEPLPIYQNASTQLTNLRSLFKLFRSSFTVMISPYSGEVSTDAGNILKSATYPNVLRFILAQLPGIVFHLKAVTTESWRTPPRRNIIFKKRLKLLGPSPEKCTVNDTKISNVPP